VSNVTSRDGTAIAFDRSGEGAPIVLVAGAFVDRSQLNELAGYWRRASRPHYDAAAAESGDTPPYECTRDRGSRALIVEAGKRLRVRRSSGAALALGAAAGWKSKAVVYEPP